MIKDWLSLSLSKFSSRSKCYFPNRPVTRSLQSANDLKPFKHEQKTDSFIDSLYRVTIRMAYVIDKDVAGSLSEALFKILAFSGLKLLDEDRKKKDSIRLLSIYFSLDLRRLDEDKISDRSLFFF
jgi:hypothetical protein